MIIMSYAAQTFKTMPLNNFVIQTRETKWVIPQNCELLKLLIAEQNLQAHDLEFSSTEHYHSFIKKLFLLALEDECKRLKPSPLAYFARALATNNNQAHKIAL